LILARPGLSTNPGRHTFRATRITACLKNTGRVEIAQPMAGHEAAPAGLYDRRGDEIALDEFESSPVRLARCP
jgi:hypothetical protein